MRGHPLRSALRKWLLILGYFVLLNVMFWTVRGRVHFAGSPVGVVCVGAVPVGFVLLLHGHFNDSHAMPL